MGSTISNEPSLDPAESGIDADYNAIPLRRE
jgi:hypothetical protein